MMSNARAYWLSFADAERGSLGACLVEVTEQEMQRARSLVPDMYDNNEGPWVLAATQKAYVRDCNPGGKCAAMRIDNHPNYATNPYPLYTLMTREEVERMGGSTISLDELETRAVESGRDVQMKVFVNPRLGDDDVLKTSLWDE